MENKKLSDVNSKSGSELIAIAHGIAANFESPATELLRELASRLECSIIRANELQQKLDAMAAENAVLKAAIADYAKVKQDFDDFDGDRRGIAESLCEAEDALVSGIKTSVTDAYLNSARAEGAIAVKDALVLADDGSDIYAIATDTAEQLRSGTHDTADKAGAK